MLTDRVTTESFKKLLTRLTKEQKGLKNRSARIIDNISVERLKRNNHRNKNHHVSYLL